MIEVKLIADNLSLSLVSKFIEDDGCGGLSFFVGNVRNHNRGKEVKCLFFEAYEAMAIKEMEKIAQHCVEKIGVVKVAIHHRLGNVDIGHPAVIIGVSAPHRKAAREACAYAIDTLKEMVPIWKKEFLQDGSYWVNATP